MSKVIRLNAEIEKNINELKHEFIKYYERKKEKNKNDKEVYENYTFEIERAKTLYTEKDWIDFAIFQTLCNTKYANDKAEGKI